MQTPSLNALDRLLGAAGHMLRTLAAEPGATRPNPAADVPDTAMTVAQRTQVAALMRVNHAGEVAAQALYHGQALFARNPDVRERLATAAREEEDHLAWCKTRLRELGGRTSRLDPFWYLGSFTVGAAAALAGDRYSLGFVEETERQVVAHLEQHCTGLPEKDRRTRAVLLAMAQDEARHGDSARDAGGQPLPWPIRSLMRGTARIMTGTAYRI